MPPRHLDLFILANAGQYPEKERVFYPLKHKLLKRHATPDGYDLQHIEHSCWTCDGTGIYTHYGYDGDILFEDSCNRCFGTGIHHTSSHILQRHNLDGHTFHIPEPLPYDALTYRPIVHILHGRFHTHSGIPPGQARRACFTLLRIYDFRRWYELIPWLQEKWWIARAKRLAHLAFQHWRFIRRLPGPSITCPKCQHPDIPTTGQVDQWTHASFWPLPHTPDPPTYFETTCPRCQETLWTYRDPNGEFAVQTDSDIPF